MFHDLFDFDRKKNKLGSNNLIKYLKLSFFDFHQISFTASQSKAQQWAWREFPNESFQAPSPITSLKAKFSSTPTKPEFRFEIDFPNPLMQSIKCK